MENLFSDNTFYGIGVALMVVYLLALTLILSFSFAQLNLLFNFLKSKKAKNKDEKYDFTDPDQIPFVTIQLPVYNEIYVMERLLNKMVELEYPKDKLEFQVLDDSTDESVTSTLLQIEKLRKEGHNIEYIHRTNRKGFKAGALKAGLEIAKGEFIAIFDADFLPESNWLYKTIPFFKNEKIGVVQTRWGHINRDYSLLTKIQAFALDAHFTLEQVGRNSQGHFINFNGTAGVWRKTCILDSGNWEGDTLTEDLDLSYRAQLKDWKFKYLVDVETPAELPVVISAARSQQFRWNKGGAENFQKMIKKVMRADNLCFKTKAHAALHLLNSSMFLNVFIVGVLSIPMLYLKNYFEDLKLYFVAMTFFGLSTLIFFVCYWFMYREIKGGGLKNFGNYFFMFFKFFSVAMGFSLHNTVAVTEGHLGKKSEFVRTPKFNMMSLKDKWSKNKYIQKKMSKSVFVEGLLTLYFGFGLISAVLVGYIGDNKIMPNEHFDFGLFPFHLMLFFGFGYVFFQSIKSVNE
ncbi:cellulose synthase family protein [Flavicella sp.]|uniref:cellulose synthase family protein n=1 Tax=Flavicella sp. TaxID=2957742 RepID=UPI0026029601|nr:cellulose synthase family protein [Flavicella sp.]MDG1805511.1 glycosyltransferase family 2 protein [Flavicella sp.]MDG2280665.1 glycosyltransferase family 2 protein [Flavicella sp.]